MESLIRELWKALPPVVQDAKRETASPAFSTFFNDIAFAPYVSALLANVSTGVAMVSECLRVPLSYGLSIVIFYGEEIDKP